MKKIKAKVSDDLNFYEGNNPIEIIEKYGSPLYVYNERIIRKHCKEMKELINYKNYKVNYSTKANSNLAILELIRDEGLNIDAMSIGEIYMGLKAGFKPEEILFVSNNISTEEMLYAIEKNVTLSVDSLSQLETYGKINKKGKIAVRINTGVGAGHHKNVITCGEKTKFGINENYVPEIKKILKKYELELIGINQHIGSLFMDYKAYLDSVYRLLTLAKEFKTLQFIDMGGGFGIPYDKENGEDRLNLNKLGDKLTSVISEFVKDFDNEIEFKTEPGRYIVAEGGVLLGKVNAIKYNNQIKFVGTDIGFNVFVRPMLYNTLHNIEIFRESNNESIKDEKVTIVGNICEAGDIVAEGVVLPEIYEKDIIGFLDTGAYGYSMSSNYNLRLRPAEVLIKENGEIKLIRKRDGLGDLIKNNISLNNL